MPLSSAGVDDVAPIFLRCEDGTGEHGRGLSEAAHRFHDEAILLLARTVDRFRQFALTDPECLVRKQLFELHIRNPEPTILGTRGLC